MNAAHPHHRSRLEEIARREMLNRGFFPDFSPETLSELDALNSPRIPSPDSVKDLRNLLWCSIDNDDSLDLDQLTAAEPAEGGNIRIWVAVADVDGLVDRGTSIDAHALHNTTSIYTAAIIFPMLPEKLSTNLTSLNQDEDRSAMVVEMLVDGKGALLEGSVYPALVRNRAKLAYDSVAAWLDGSAPPPGGIDQIPGLQESLHLQDRTAHSMENLRHQHGALTLETIEARAVFEDNTIQSLRREVKNRAHTIIEDFMIAANTTTARYLTDHGYPSVHRVVRVPERWDRIVELVREHGGNLPAHPNAIALQQFLAQENVEHPQTFPDISLAIIKLIGSGEYVAEKPGREAPGHFGLAVTDYTHSTAPNRRYPDLIIQRQLKAALAKQSSPYSYELLVDLSQHLTEKEDDAKKVERTVAKSAAAMMLSDRIGATFEGIVTGASQKGTWARVLSIPVEGKVVHGAKGLDVGQRVRVKLVSVDIDRGFIDFKRI